MLFYEYKKDRDKVYIFHIKKNRSKKKFLKTIKLKPGGFSGNLFAKVYDCFLSEMIDLHDEYKRYHNREYSTFDQFLQKKYNLPADIARSGEEKLSKHKKTALFSRKEHVTGEYNLEMFAMSPDGALNILNSVLGVSDEN